MRFVTSAVLRCAALVEVEVVVHDGGGGGGEYCCIQAPGREDPCYLLQLCVIDGTWDIFLGYRY